MSRQKNKRRSFGESRKSGVLRDGAFGDKEIAVKIRGNSHYRNSCGRTGQVGMLIGLWLVKVSWAKWGDEAQIRGYPSDFFGMAGHRYKTRALAEALTFFGV